MSTGRSNHTPLTPASPRAAEDLAPPEFTGSASPWIAVLGAFVGFSTTVFGSFIHYMTHREADEYAAISLYVGAIAGAILCIPSGIAAFASARAFRWRSERSMLLAGIVAALAVPLLMFIVLTTVSAFAH